MYARLKEDVKQVKRAAKTSFLGESSFKRHKESMEEHEGQVRQGVQVDFKELVYKLLARIQDKPYYKKPLSMGGDPKKKPKMEMRLP